MLLDSKLKEIIFSFKPKCNKLIEYIKLTRSSLLKGKVNKYIYPLIDI